MKLNTDSPVFEFLGTFADFVGLNLLFLITCLPIITIGPALCALFTVTLRESRGEHGYILSTYLKAFKNNLKSGIGIFLIYLLIGGILLFNIVFWMEMETMLSSVITVILIPVTILYIMSAFYVFALNARYENSIKQTIRNAFSLPFTSPFLSLLMLVIPVMILFLVWVTPILKVLFIIFGAAFIAYCESFLLTKVFEKFEPEQVQEEEYV